MKVICSLPICIGKLCQHLSNRTTAIESYLWIRSNIRDACVVSQPRLPSPLQKFTFHTSFNLYIYIYDYIAHNAELNFDIALEDFDKVMENKATTCLLFM